MSYRLLVANMHQIQYMGLAQGAHTICMVMNVYMLLINVFTL